MRRIVAAGAIATAIALPITPAAAQTCVQLQDGQIVCGRVVDPPQYQQPPRYYERDPRQYDEPLGQYYDRPPITRWQDRSHWFKDWKNLARTIFRCLEKGFSAFQCLHDGLLT